MPAAMPQLPRLEIQHLSQLQLPSCDAAWNPGLPAYVTSENAWRKRREIAVGLVGPAPPLPADSDDLSTWTWHCPGQQQQASKSGQDVDTEPGAAEQVDAEPAVEVEADGRRLRFFRRVSRGTAAARARRPLNNGRFYWELRLGDRMFGTSIMVGVGTAAVRDSTATFKNIIGEDEHGWGLSHKGVVWHGGLWSPYTEPFPQNEATTIGVLFDGVAGTLGFFKDDRWLGVAFTGLDKVPDPLYPVVASTARNTKMTLVAARRELGSLVERCRAVVLRRVAAPRELRRLPLPAQVRNYLLEGVVTPVTLPATNPAHRLLI